MATVYVRGDRDYSVQLPFEGRAPMAMSSDSKDFDCDRTNVESFSGCRVFVSRNDTPATRLPSILPSWLPSVITGTTFLVSTGAINGNHIPSYHGNHLRHYHGTIFSIITEPSSQLSRNHLPSYHGNHLPSYHGNHLPR